MVVAGAEAQGRGLSEPSSVVLKPEQSPAYSQDTSWHPQGKKQPFCREFVFCLVIDYHQVWLSPQDPKPPGQTNSFLQGWNTVTFFCCHQTSIFSTYGKIHFSTCCFQSCLHFSPPQASCFLYLILPHSFLFTHHRPQPNPSSPPTKWCSRKRNYSMEVKAYQKYPHGMALTELTVNSRKLMLAPECKNNYFYGCLFPSGLRFLESVFPDESICTKPC